MALKGRKYVNFPISMDSLKNADIFCDLRRRTLPGNKYRKQKHVSDTETEIEQKLETKEKNIDTKSYNNKLAPMGNKWVDPETHKVVDMKWNENNIVKVDSLDIDEQLYEGSNYNARKSIQTYILYLWSIDYGP